MTFSLPENSIDSHNHLMAEDGYATRHIEAAERLGIRRTVISGLGAAWGMADNPGVLAAAERYPDRLIPLFYVRLGDDKADAVCQAKRQGFMGLKLILPPFPYDDERAFPIYEKAEELSLPVLFHCGVMAHAKGVITSSEYMRPLRVDGIARRFPGLRIQIAHLGVPEYECAATMARIIPNIHVDMTGGIRGWLVPKTPEFFQRLFYWPTWHRKLIFGTDVRFELLGQSLQQHISLLGQLSMGDAEAANMFRDNAREFYGEIERDPYKSVATELTSDHVEDARKETSE